MYSSKCNPDKPGVKRLDEIDGFAVIANKELYDQGRAQRFAVVNTKEHWVDSVHENRREARAYTETLR